MARLTGHSQRQIRYWAKARTVAPLAIQLRAGKRGYWWQRDHPALVGWIRRNRVMPGERGRRGRKPIAAYLGAGQVVTATAGRTTGQQVAGLIKLASTLARRWPGVLRVATPEQRAKLTAACLALNQSLAIK